MIVVSLVVVFGTDSGPDRLATFCGARAASDLSLNMPPSSSRIRRLLGLVGALVAYWIAFTFVAFEHG
jgi:hypothetical protein